MEFFANEGKNVEIEVNGKTYLRHAIKTRFVKQGENYIDIFKEYVSPIYEKGDIVSSSEKIIALCQNRVVKREDIKIGFWAKFLSKFASHPDTGVGVGETIKMQYAIDTVGLLKVLWASIASAVTKLFGKKGVFYEIVGQEVSGLDGFYDHVWKEYGDIGIKIPENPSRVCDEIKEKLSESDVIQDIKRTTELSKELSSLEDIVNSYSEYKTILSGIKEAHEMENDKDLGEFAKEEILRLGPLKEEKEKELEIMLIPKDPNDDKNVIVEIRGAAGGDEANIFAGDLFDMYTRYAESKGWSYEVTNEVIGTSGGYSQIEFIIKGHGAYSKLKYESGAHRVQRVPVTETQGRVHTSTATVLVMPEAEELDFDLDMNDVRVDITRSSGCGGQGVNTTDSAVRLTHIPTGIVVYSQTERSQIKNKDKAIKILKTRLYDLKLREKEEKEGAERRSKIGTGDRSEKIRTYNFPQNRLTDHRINFTLMQLDRVMMGKLDEVIDALIAEDQKRKLQSEI